MAVADAQPFASGEPHRPALPRKEVSLNICKEPLRGMEPERLLNETLKKERDLMFPNDEGIAPVSLLMERSSSSRFERFPRDSGISPDRPFASKSSNFRDVKLLKDSGIRPVRLLCERSLQKVSAKMAMRFQNHPKV